MTSVELLASYWTLAGAVLPRSERQESPHRFEARAQAAAAAGYRGLGLMHDDVRSVARRMGTTAMREVLEANGLTHLELEFLGDWFASGERRAKGDALTSELLQAAQALGARHVKAGGDRHGVHWPMTQLADEFAALCEQARTHGTRIALELLPWTQLDTVAQGLDLLQKAGWPPNGGLLLDVWHLHRAGQAWADIASMPAAAIAAVELSDAGPATGDVWDDTIRRRRYCGEGSIDVSGFIRAVLAAGYQGPWGIEMISDEHRTLALDAAATRAFDTTHAALVAAGART